MFTGLIEKTGFLKSIERINGGAVLAIEHDLWETPLRKGDSMAVNGACLTVTGSTTSFFTCDALDETLMKTNLGIRKNGARLNLERALKVGDHVGGHFVSGHVDGMARVEEIRRVGRDRIVRFACAAEILQGIVMKGSVACDGISLTVSAISGADFEVNIIPLTWDATNLQFLAISDLVNIETDMIGKFVRRCLTNSSSGTVINYDDLHRTGFID